MSAGRRAQAVVAAAGALLAAISACPCPAAPLRPFAPVDICGRIVEQSFQPSETRPGRPGLSGSLGRDRTFPAHLRVIINDYAGIDAATARRINAALGFTDLAERPTQVLLRLPTDNPTLLAGVSRICVEGFRITGDEGGTWTQARRVIADRNRR